MHIGTARRLSREAGEQLEDIDLASFVQGTPEFEHYVTDMLWAQDYALANR
jgi:tRNA-splicing ligase RtcB